MQHPQSQDGWGRGGVGHKLEESSAFTFSRCQEYTLKILLIF